MKYLSTQQWDQFNQSMSDLFGVEHTPMDYDPPTVQPLSFHNAWQGQKDTEETKQAKSEAKRANWLDPASSYNSPEYKQKLSKTKTVEHRAKLATAQSNLWKDPAYAKNHANKVAADYIVTDPQGNCYAIRNLAEHCRQHGLTRSLMIAVVAGKQHHHRGWTCRMATAKR